MTSSVWVPMEPVDPTTLTVVMGAPGLETDLEEADQVVGGGEHDEDGVEAVEQATVSRQHRPHVLDAEIALHEGLGEVAERCHDRYHETEGEGTPDVPRVHAGHHAAWCPACTRGTSGVPSPSVSWYRSWHRSATSPSPS